MGIEIVLEKPKEFKQIIKTIAKITDSFNIDCDENALSAEWKPSQRY